MSPRTWAERVPGYVTGCLSVLALAAGAVGAVGLLYLLGRAALNVG